MKHRRTENLSSKAKKPKDRTLAEFGKLTLAETIVLDACRKGMSAFLSPTEPYELPKEPTEQNTIRPEFIRFLALGGDENAPVHEVGVRVYGAWIDGNLDFQFCDLPHPLCLDWCALCGDLNLSRAHARTLRLNGSIVGEIIGDGFQCDAGLFMKRGFYARSGVRLPNARIGGELNCSGGYFQGRDGISLFCDGIKVDGSVVLAWEEWNGKLFRFNSDGPVHFNGAEITGNLDCDGGRFDGKAGFSLACDGAEIKGNLFLRIANKDIGPIRVGAPGQFLYFEATSTVRFVGSRIGGDFDCLGAKFNSLNGHALICDEAAIGGRLLIRESPQAGFVIPMSISGLVSFNGARVATLVDDIESWEKASALNIDNFSYGRISASSPNDVRARIHWLELQRRSYLTTDFAHQPWEQLANVFAEASRDEEAKIVRVQMRKRQRYAYWRYQRTFGRKLWCFVSTRFDWLLGLLVGYGYRPWRTVWAFVGIWLLGALIYALAATRGIMVPADTKIFLDKSVPSECQTDWGIYSGPSLPSLTDVKSAPDPTRKADLQAKIDADVARRRNEATRLNLAATEPTWAVICRRSLPPEYAAFSPLLYSLDLIVPLLDLNQKKRWTQLTMTENGDVFRPLIFNTVGAGHLVKLWQWFEMLAGLFLSLLLAATVSGIVKKG